MEVWNSGTDLSPPRICGSWEGAGQQCIAVKSQKLGDSISGGAVIACGAWLGPSVRNSLLLRVGDNHQETFFGHPA